LDYGADTISARVRRRSLEELLAEHRRLVTSGGGSVSGSATLAA
jgi:hypothetical protein